jgi:serine/threonine-protein kinase PpkA
MTAAAWHVESVIGRGRHATVYLARPRHGGLRVALKVGAAGAHAAIAREHQALQALAHAGVVRALEHGEHEGRPCIALEYLPQGSVAKLALPLDDARVGALLRGAASSLAWLHRHGWVHRDVKPAHLLLRADGEPVLADFGCACRVGETDAAPAGTVTGTPAYAAPEQMQGAPAQPAADVYALGACLHELLTGTPPYRGETLLELTSQHLRAPVPVLPAARAAWQPLLDALLAKDARRRPADGQAVLHQLERMAGRAPKGPHL